MNITGLRSSRMADPVLVLGLLLAMLALAVANQACAPQGPVSDSDSASEPSYADDMDDMEALEEATDEAINYDAGGYVGGSSAGGGDQEPMEDGGGETGNSGSEGGTSGDR